EVVNPSDAFKDGKASVAEVYAFILQDVKDAVANLPDSYDSNNLGRVTKGAALTLLGDIHLTQKQYPEAVAAFGQVKTLGYSLLPDYANCFNPNSKNNAESIFEIQYDQSIEGENSNFIYMFGPRDAKVKLVGFTGNLGGSNIPTPSLYNLYEAGDLRKDKSIALFDDPSSAKYPESKGFAGKMPNIKKYYHAPYIEDGRSNENLPIYRYGHVLLLLAEAQNEAGTGDPLTNLNLVRKRAGLTALTGLSKDALRTAIAKEQRLEVAFENHRWFQLLRTGEALKVMNEHGVEEKKRLTRLSAASYKVEAFKLLFPIPQREVQVNGIEQNKGY
ncbi:MAG: RagB/SusD family nutrient uptake outer membrane protein, partial [Sphingobacterium sp.]